MSCGETPPPPPFPPNTGGFGVRVSGAPPPTPHSLSFSCWSRTLEWHTHFFWFLIALQIVNFSVGVGCFHSTLLACVRSLGPPVFWKREATSAETLYEGRAFVEAATWVSWHVSVHFCAKRSL